MYHVYCVLQDAGKCINTEAFSFFPLFMAVHTSDEHNYFLPI